MGISSKRAFTLVELLVVVAIISILIALLLPTLHGALATSRNVSCMNNHKTIGVAMLSYVDDNRGWGPSGDYAAWNPGSWVTRNWSW